MRKFFQEFLDFFRKGDMILLAGKGHENYQLIGATRVPFSEAAILREALEERTGALVY